GLPVLAGRRRGAGLRPQGELLAGTSWFQAPCGRPARGRGARGHRRRLGDSDEHHRQPYQRLCPRQARLLDRVDRPAAVHARSRRLGGERPGLSRPGDNLGGRPPRPGRRGAGLPRRRLQRPQPYRRPALFEAHRNDPGQDRRQMAFHPLGPRVLGVLRVAAPGAGPADGHLDPGRSPLRPLPPHRQPPPPLRGPRHVQLLRHLPDNPERPRCLRTTRL
ncbi:MAG: CAAX amino terminal protease family protein, partial [uncultured Rubrobacteraceae bacterium]